MKVAGRTKIRRVPDAARGPVVADPELRLSTTAVEIMGSVLNSNGNQLKNAGTYNRRSLMNRKTKDENNNPYNICRVNS